MKRVEVEERDVCLLPFHFSPVDVARHFATRFNLQGEDDAFYVMNMDQVLKQFEEWKELLPRVEPFYAVKCNNDPVLLRVLASLGCGFDCASKKEMETVLGLRVRPDRLLYANPCKTRNYIRHAEKCGVSMMTFDNEEELCKIASIYPGADLILRIAVTDPTAVCQLNVKFGCSPALAPQLLAIAADMKLNVVGVSFHVGSGARDPSAFREGIRVAKQLFDFGRGLGHAMKIVDIGGGYPGFPSEEITFQQIAYEVNEALDKHFPEGAGEVRVIAEPGRFFASSVFSLVCNIIAKTRVPARRIEDTEMEEYGFMYYINDGVYGSFNCILYDHFQPTGVPLFGNGAGEAASSVWGPTCDGLDVVIPSYRVAEMQEGDWMLFENMGAYTASAGSEFNGFPLPKTYYVGQSALWEELWDGQELCPSLPLWDKALESDGPSSGISSVVSSSEETDQE